MLGNFLLIPNFPAYKSVSGLQGVQVGKTERFDVLIKLLLVLLFTLHLLYPLQFKTQHLLLFHKRLQDLVSNFTKGRHPYRFVPQWPSSIPSRPPTLSCRTNVTAKNSPPPHPYPQTSVWRFSFNKSIFVTMPKPFLFCDSIAGAVCADARISQLSRVRMDTKNISQRSKSTAVTRRIGAVHIWSFLWLNNNRNFIVNICC